MGKPYSQLAHNIQQALVAVYIMILDLACGQLIEKFPGAFYFCLLDRTQVQAFHCSFCFSNKINVLYRSFIKGNRPVQRIIPNRSWNGKAFRQLGIDADFVSTILRQSGAPRFFLCFRL
ncbi:MAG: hypothetical protein PWP71_1715 [Clostridia bacterium]|nr:hypothetical protein [Clostridia bacterium]